ncbi:MULTISPECIES: hypothetical protein [unclassified Cupriavidus]|uniref:hypothetical protein n=1 Tax=unclassified Cupriavidus TaxID=2640874 RepID=UPI00201792F1|nr:hypothetical protein [Cupriavidus sp. 2SB]
MTGRAKLAMAAHTVLGVLCGVGIMSASLVTVPAMAQSPQAAVPRGDMAGSVVSRLVASRAQSDQPVALASLTTFEWDSFSVERTPAGVAMANCNRDGLVPCEKDLQPSPDTLIQVLRFDQAGKAVYQERIIVASGNFAEPLPAAVPRGQAMLVTCADGRGGQLWCLQSAPRAPLRLMGLDGA